MGRFIFGVGLLLVALALCVMVMFLMTNTNQPIAQILEKAAQTALAGDLEVGIRLANEAQTTWEKAWHKTAAFSDHAPMDEIDSLFALVEYYGKTGNVTEFTSHCARLSQLIIAVGEAHALNWWNLL